MLKLKRKWKSVLMGILASAILTVATFASLAPFIWLLLTSLKPLEMIWAKPPIFFFMPTLNNYLEVLGRTPFPVFLARSAIVTSSTTVLSLMLGCPAAYALVRLGLRRSDSISFWLLSLRMLPPVATLVPLFVMFKWAHLLDTLLSLIIAYTVFNVPFVVWAMMSFFSEVPKELDESAMIDGCSRFSTFFRIILPLTRTGIVATAIFCVFFSWNEFLYALIFTGPNSRTAPVGVVSELNWQYIGWGQVAAAATIVMLPVLAFTLFVQKYLVRGLTFGAIKG